MNRCPVYALVLLLGAGCLVAFGHPQKLTAASPGSGDTIHDAASFIAELHHLAVLLKRKPSTNEMAALRDTLPRHWTVSTPERIYLISSEPLQNQLTALSSEKARVWVERLAAEIEGYSVAVPAGSSQARAELDRILARSEFAGVRPPSAWELFRQRIAAWVDRMLMKLFEGIGRHPIGGNILFWLLMIGGVVCIALWRAETASMHCRQAIPWSLRALGKSGFAPHVRLPTRAIFAKPSTPPIGLPLPVWKTRALYPKTAQRLLANIFV
jgi:hypothetical protein